jgi:hypothetical protein
MNKLFKEACVEEDEFFIILCELLPVQPDVTNVEEFYNYIRMLRKLPKPFYVRLDTTNGPFSSYIQFLPKIIKELCTKGTSNCLEMEISLLNSLVIVPVVNNVIELAKLISPVYVPVKLNII